jgi:membrane protein implicated in regulation of membrane protease activity
MPEKESSSSPSSSNSIPSVSKLEGVILLLSLLIKIGKYLPWIVLAFAAVSMTLAVFCFTWWNNIAGGILNLVLAIAGFIFFAQLVRRRKIHRYNYRYTGKDQHRETNTTEERKVRAEVR